MQDAGDVQVLKISNDNKSPRIDISFGKMDEPIFSSFIDKKFLGFGCR